MDPQHWFKGWVAKSVPLPLATTVLWVLSEILSKEVADTLYVARQKNIIIYILVMGLPSALFRIQICFRKG
jgi:hypothetical protein